MGVFEIILGIILIFFSIILVSVVLLQEGNQKNLGTVSGGADTFLSKNKARTADAMLARGTKFVAIAFFVLVLVMDFITK